MKSNILLGVIHSLQQSMIAGTSHISVAGSSNIIKGTVKKNITIINQAPIPFVGIQNANFLSSLTFTSGIFTRANGESVSLECKFHQALSFAPNNVPIVGGTVPSTIIAVTGGVLSQIYSENLNTSNNRLAHRNGNRSKRHCDHSHNDSHLNTHDTTSCFGHCDRTTMGTELHVVSGTLYITNYDSLSMTGTIDYVSLIVTSAILSDTTSSFSGTTYTETLNTSSLNIPIFDNNSITMGGFNIVTCIESSTDLPNFWEKKSVVIVVKNTNINKPIKVTIYNNLANENEIYNFGNAEDVINAGDSSVYLQLSTKIFTKLFGD
jgi:hypothetical protein